MMQNAEIEKAIPWNPWDCPPHSLVKLCFSSDFFIEDADAWRDGCWDFIRRRGDCRFVITTKRPERIKDCVPSDWGDGWEHVYISVSIENQQMADLRLKAFKERGMYQSKLVITLQLAGIDIFAFFLQPH